ncbi:hypothetical protein N9045_01470 [bacterium]|nr:hypothetical protein [bacterium]
MSSLYVFALYNKNKRPCCIGIKDGDNVKVCELYRPGAGKTIKRIETTLKIFKKIIVKANDDDVKIVTSDFKSLLVALNLPLDARRYNVFDLHLPEIPTSNSASKDHKIVKQVLDKISKKSAKPYQNIMAQAAVVYQDLENNGLSVNDMPMYPQWSMKTFSGRSKTTGFNLQGLHEEFHVTPDHGNESDILIHFDWICADIRVASYMSGDEDLNRSFIDSDPYNLMMDIVNVGSDDKITREESKLYLLKSINSMDVKSVALSKVYPELGGWISNCKKLIGEGKPLETMLQRKFKLSRSKNELAVLNGVMQGSVAHAMQLTIRRVWEKLPTKLVGEIHDCLVMSSSLDQKEIKSIVEIVAPIMRQPFEGIIKENPVFPLNVSIGKKWKKLKSFRTYR